jgi:hypothetical protein
MPFAAALAARPVPQWRAYAPAWTTAPVPGQLQQAGLWCWLAAAASVDAMHGGAWTQCALAHQLIPGAQGCCANPNSVFCDRAGSVDVALQKVGHYQSTAVLRGAVPAIGGLAAALGAGEPPVAQIAFRGGGNHVVLVAAHGTDGTGADIVRLGDPAPGYNPTDLYWAHAGYYRGGVTWTHVCWTG